MYLYSIYSSVSAIAKKLEGLPGWIAGGKLVGFAKERSWKKFQANILNVKVENVADYLVQYIATDVYDKLLEQKHPAYPLKDYALEHPIDTVDKEIIAYIAGCIMHKLKKRYK